MLTHTVRSPFFTGPLDRHRVFRTRSPTNASWMNARTSRRSCRVQAAASERRAVREGVSAAAKAAGWWHVHRRAGYPKNRVTRGRASRAVSTKATTGLRTVADVDVEQSTGRVSVKRLVMAHDCGPMSNPDGVPQPARRGAPGHEPRLSRRGHLGRSEVTSIDWRTYRSLPLGFDVPVLESVLINRIDGEAMGAGETSITLSAAAIGNAIFDATGARIREVPFTPDRVKRALDARR